ncbi:MAG: cytochrome b/b6 domain-containing protein, partial [Gammaproteobacteria bacterium]
MNDNKTVQVWDIWIRLFHWSLVAMFIVAYFTAEEENIIHIYSGYAVPGLITFRIVWGFIGTKYARFSDFIYGSKRLIQYIRGLLTGKPEHYLGHN